MEICNILLSESSSLSNSSATSERVGNSLERLAQKLRIVILCRALLGARDKEEVAIYEFWFCC